MIPSLIRGVRSTRYLLTLAGAAVLILVVGALTRPRDEAAPPASDADLARLARLSQRRTLDNMTGYFGAIAAAADPSMVRLRDQPTTAIAWNQGLIVAARVDDPFPRDVTLTTPGGEVTAHVVLRRPDVPIVVIATPALSVVPARRSSTLVRSGDWIVAHWAGARAHSFVHGSVLDIVRGPCGERSLGQIVPTFALTASMAGGGLFDIDGSLLGVILPCADRVAVVDTDGIETLLHDGDSVENRLLSRYGARAGILSTNEAAYFKHADGLIVREVWARYAAHSADLRPGDVIRAIDGASVTGPDDLQRLADASADSAPRLTIQRGSTRVEITLDGRPPAAGSPVADAEGRGLALQPSEGYRIDAVTPDSPAARAGIRPGDRLLRIDLAVPSSVEQGRRLLNSTRSRPAFIEIERGGRRFGVLLP